MSKVRLEDVGYDLPAEEDPEDPEEDLQPEVDEPNPGALRDPVEPVERPEMVWQDDGGG